MLLIAYFRLHLYKLNGYKIAKYMHLEIPNDEIVNDCSALCSPSFPGLTSSRAQ